MKAAAVRSKPGVAYGIAAGLAVLAIILRLALVPLLGHAVPFVTVIPAVLLAAYWCGPTPAVVTAVLAGSVASYFWLPPYERVDLTRVGVIAVLLYGGASAVAIWLSNSLFRFARMLEGERDRALALAAERATLFSELQHRVANNLGFVSSLLRLQKTQLERQAGTEATVDVLLDSIERLEMIGRINRRLYQPESIDAGVGTHLKALCEDLIASSGAGDRIRCEVVADPVALDLRRLTAVSTLVMELVTNSIKHAFAGGRAGTVRIELRRRGAALNMTISDDGPGMPESKESTRGLGIIIITSLARQLDATLRLPLPGENATTLSFPL